MFGRVTLRNVNFTLFTFSSLQPSLFPILLLLSRLYPSPLDETNSPISMKPFLPLLIRSVFSHMRTIFDEGKFQKFSGWGQTCETTANEHFAQCTCVHWYKFILDFLQSLPADVKISRNLSSHKLKFLLHCIQLVAAALLAQCGRQGYLQHAPSPPW